MWIVLLIIFSGPMEISKTEVLEMHWSEQKCVARITEAKEMGLPKNSNIGCIYLKEVSKT